MFSWFPMLKSLTQKLICINLAPTQGQQALRRSSVGFRPSVCLDEILSRNPSAHPLDPCGARIKIQIVVLRTDPHSSDLTTHCIGRNDYSLLLLSCPLPLDGSWEPSLLLSWVPGSYERAGDRLAPLFLLSFFGKVVNVSTEILSRQVHSLNHTPKQFHYLLLFSCFAFQ